MCSEAQANWAELNSWTALSLNLDEATPCESGQDCGCPHPGQPREGGALSFPPLLRNDLPVTPSGENPGKEAHHPRNSVPSLARSQGFFYPSVSIKWMFHDDRIEMKHLA